MHCNVGCFFFFFKQKTAYEMRISDWSSDVCSSDLGGNVEGAVAGEVVERHGVTIVGHRNVPSRLAADTSALFARNLYNFLSAFWDKDAGRPLLPDGDEIGDAIRLTRGGQVVNPRLLQN